MRYALLWVCFALITSCQQKAVDEVTASLPAVQTRSLVDKASITTGETLTFGVEVDHLPSIEIKIPEIGAQIAGLRIVDMGQDPIKERAGRTYQRRWYQLRADLVGSYILPSLTLTYEHENKRHALETSEIFLEVQSVLPEDGSAQDIRELKSVIRPKTKPPWKWILLATIILLGTIIAWWRRQHKKTMAHIAPPIPAHEIAYRALNTLRQTDFTDTQALRQYFFAISEIIRLYVENRFGLNATDLTLEEIKCALKERQLLSPKEREALETFLEKTDRIKFAKEEIQETDVENVYEGALSFVESTHEVIEEAA